MRKLKFVLHINDKGYISIDLYPEVSSVILDATTQVPLAQVTKVHTQIVVKDGDTFLLGGLLIDRQETLNKKIPILPHIATQSYASSASCAWLNLLKQWHIQNIERLILFLTLFC